MYWFGSPGSIIDNKQQDLILILTIRFYLNVSKMMISCPTSLSPGGDFTIIVLESCLCGRLFSPCLMQFVTVTS